jgi:hypothetical protein
MRIRTFKLCKSCKLFPESILTPIWLDDLNIDLAGQTGKLLGTGVGD